MKKLSLFLGMAVAASLSLTYCAKNEIAPSEPVNKDGVPFEISASLSTKTVNDGLDTKWAEGDKINLFHAVAGTTTYTSDKDFTLDANREGVFTGELASALISGTNYDWYAIYPYEEVLETPANNAETKKYIYVGGRSDTPAVQEGNNSMAHLVGDYAPLWGKALGVASDVMPSMQMLNLASVVAVNVKNTTSEPLTVTSVSLTSTESLVGTFYVDITGESVKYVDGTYTSFTATLKVNGATALANGEEAIFYIPIKPHTAKAGSTLTLSVNGYEKESPALTKDVTFTAGKIKTLKFDYDNTSVSKTALFDFTDPESLGITKPEKSNGTNISGQSVVVDKITMTSTDGGTNTRVWNKSDACELRVYDKGTLTFKAESGYNITRIEFTGTAKFTDIIDSKWTGSEQSVTLTNGSSSSSIKTITVTYEPGEVKPLINAFDIAGISALGESAGKLAYTIDNPVEGTTISAACDGTIVTEVLDNEDGKTFLYEVSKNTGDAREGWIKLTYGDVEKTVKVSQNAPEFKVSRTEVELGAENSSQSTITITSDFGWTATTSTGADFLIDPEDYTEGKASDGKTTMTIIAGSANTSEEGPKTLGTITITNAETSATLTVNVSQASSYVAPVVGTQVEFVAGTDKSSINSITKNGVKISIKDGTFNRDDNYRLYANNSMTISVDTGKNIKKIETTEVSGNANLSGEGFTRTNLNSIWTGSATSVKLTASKQSRITKIVVTYE